MLRPDTEQRRRRSRSRPAAGCSVVVIVRYLKFGGAGFSYIAAMTGISKLNYAVVPTVLLVLLVNFIMLALIEVPLISFAVAPAWTPRAIDRAKAWFARNSHRIAVGGTAVLGVLLIVRGLVTLFS